MTDHEGTTRRGSEGAPSHSAFGAVATTGAPAAIGPYAQAVRTGDLVFTSGQLGLDPSSGRLVDGGIEAQTQQVFRNLAAVLEAAGTDLAHVVKATVFLADMSDFPAMNAIYAAAMGEARPARTTIGVAGLPLGGRVEIDMVARIV